MGSAQAAWETSPASGNFNSLRMAPFISGEWYGPPTDFGTGGAFGATDGYLGLAAFPVPVTQRFTAMGVNVFTAGTGGSAFRLCIYRDDGAGPNTLMLDAGTVATDAINRFQTPINITLPPGFYWIGGGRQGGATGPAVQRLATQIRGAQPNGIPSNFSAVASGFQRGGVITGGALPTSLIPLPVDFEIAGDLPYTWLRAA